MIPNNNLSVLPWYSSVQDQNARKWWAYGRAYPLYVPQGHIPTFQILREHSSAEIVSFELYKCDGTFVDDFLDEMLSGGLAMERVGQYDVLLFGSQSQVLLGVDVGTYYAKVSDGNESWYSDFFTMTDRLEHLVKVVWWDESNLEMDAGVIVYPYAVEAQFKNVLYLDAQIAKPTYEFTEEGEERNGYFFPLKQISKKVFHFSFLAPEYLLDVMRFIRMSDHVEIEQDGKKYSLDTFQMDSNWEGDGDIASVDVNFTTATVAKKVGVGFVKAMRGDFNDDFNDDFLT